MFLLEIIKSQGNFVVCRLELEGKKVIQVKPIYIAKAEVYAQGYLERMIKHILRQGCFNIHRSTNKVILTPTEYLKQYLDKLYV